MEVLSDHELDSDNDRYADPLDSLDEDSDELEDQLYMAGYLTFDELEDMYADTPPPEPDGTLGAALPEEVLTYRRVLGDAFHVLKLLPLKKKHSCFRAFMRYYSNAVFIRDHAIMQKVEHVLVTRYNSSVKEELKSSRGRAYLTKRLPRICPDPPRISRRVQLVFKYFADQKCIKTGEVFFNTKVKQQAKHILQTFRQGYYSDPPGKRMYYVIGEDKDGLDLYGFRRGTSGVEGAWHQEFSRRFGCYVLSGKQGDMVLSSFVTQRNYRIGVEKRGVADCKHRDLALEDTIASAFTELTGEVYRIDNVPWDSASNFLDSGETTGISSMRHMVDNNQIQSIEERFRDINLTPDHAYVAETQNLPTPLLPIGTPEERTLFTRLVDDGLTNAQMLRAWIPKVDGVNIFMKLESHFQAARTSLERRRNEARTRAKYPGLQDLAKQLDDKTETVEVSEQQEDDAVRYNIHCGANEAAATSSITNTDFVDETARVRSQQHPALTDTHQPIRRQKQPIPRLPQSLRVPGGNIGTVASGITVDNAKSTVPRVHKDPAMIERASARNMLRNADGQATSSTASTNSGKVPNRAIHNSDQTRPIMYPVNMQRPPTPNLPYQPGYAHKVPILPNSHYQPPRVSLQPPRKKCKFCVVTGCNGGYKRTSCAVFTSQK